MLLLKRLLFSFEIFNINDGIIVVVVLLQLLFVVVVVVVVHDADLAHTTTYTLIRSRNKKLTMMIFLIAIITVIVIFMSIMIIVIIMIVIIIIIVIILCFRHPTPPSHNGDGYWHEYTTKDKNYLHIGPGNMGMKRSLRADKAAFWNKLLPKLMAKTSVTIEKCNFTDRSFTGVIVTGFVGVLVLLLLQVAVVVKIFRCRSPKPRSL